MRFRPSTTCVAISLVIAGVAPAPAQPAPQPLIQLPSAGSADAIPDRVGRIASVTGAVSFHFAGATQWQVATPNLPLTTGAALWVGPGAEAALGIAGNRLLLGAETEFDIDRLDDRTLAATQPQGASYLHLRDVLPGHTYTVQTPRGIVSIATVGRYEVVSGDTEHPTTVTVLEGAATVTGLPTAAEIGPMQTLTILGDGVATPFAPALSAATQDEFLRRAIAAERPAPARNPARNPAPAFVAQMTGAEALDGVGEWADTADDGPVWYPPAGSDYVPYRQGRWGYVAPWGWTWIDAAPWGFAPTHYGRWAQRENRWCWVPGRAWAPDRRPVYAPALVAFFGGVAGAAIGWAPLGPREAYRPPYAVGERALEGLNRPTGAEYRANTAATGPITIINRQAVTFVPSRVLTGSGDVAGAIRPVPPGALPLRFRPPIAPTRATIGATQAVLQRVNPPGLTAPASHVASGPAIATMPRVVGPNGATVGGSIIGGAAMGSLFRPGAGTLLRPPSAASLPELRPRGGLRPGAIAGAGLPPIARPGPAPGLAPRLAPGLALPRVLPEQAPRLATPAPHPDLLRRPPPTAAERGPLVPAGPRPDLLARPRSDLLAGPRPDLRERPRPAFHDAPRPVPVQRAAPMAVPRVAPVASPRQPSPIARPAPSPRAEPAERR